MGTSNMVIYWVFKKFISVVSQVVFIWSGLHLTEISHSLVECRVSNVDMMTSLLLRKNEDFAKCVIRDVVWTHTGSNCMEPRPTIISLDVQYLDKCVSKKNTAYDFTSVNILSHVIRLTNFGPTLYGTLCWAQAVAFPPFHVKIWTWNCTRVCSLSIKFHRDQMKTTWDTITQSE